MIKYIYLFILLLLPLPSVANQTINNNTIDHWPNERYIVHDDGTVTDTNTSLMWMQCSLGLSGADCSVSDGNALTYTWQEALESVSAYNENEGFAGYTDWRPPNAKELGSLLAYNRYDPAINSTIFPNTPSANTWSASPSTRYNNGYKHAWRPSFKTGTIYEGFRTQSNYVRLVRSID